jgi:zinc transporter ZupT
MLMWWAAVYCSDYELPSFALAVLLSALLMAQVVLQKRYLVAAEGPSGRWFGWSEERLTYFIPIILMLMLSLHALTEGVVLGAQTAMPSFSTLMLAVLLHKGSESLGLVTSMNTAPYKQSQRMSLLFLFALMTPIGLFLGQEMLVSVFSNDLIVGLFNALAAMTFVYISQRCQSQCLFKSSTFKAQPRIERACFYGALVLMGILALWF